jgi:NAD(P)-dependent dehydrogenase (short-subunit alcohol dehydrogenase family)
VTHSQTDHSQTDEDIHEMSTTPAARVWLVTGASSGFGRAITEAAVAAGDVVVAAARRTAPLDELVTRHPDRVEAVSLDVTDAASGREVVDDVVARYGRLDVLVNNAGHTQVGAAEETTDQELRDLFEVHFHGPVALTVAALPHFRRQHGGAVVQLSSVGGQVTAPGFSAYCATKFALEGWSETLASEVAPFGVTVLIVEPGAFRTSLFTPGAAHASAEMPEYAETVGPTREYVSSGDGSQAGDPAKAASAILTALDGDTPLRLVLGADAVAGILDRLHGMEAEVEKWAPVSRGTAFDDR